MTRTILAGLGALLVVWASPAEEKKDSDPGKNRADEAKVKTASIEQGAKFLDSASLAWTERRECATCHTNVPHLMAVPSLKRKATESEQAVRKFFEGRVGKWDGVKKKDHNHNADVVTVAVALAFHDAGTTGKLHASTRSALDRMWTLQQKDGGWNWIKCNWPPLEHDDYYGAVLAALGVGIAPGDYAKSDKAKEGLAKLKGYLKKTPPPTLHHKALLMWASLRMDDLMTKEDRAKTVKEIVAKQRKDGGWSLPSLGDWKGYDGRDNNTDAESDGYATGLMVYVLRQAEVKKDDSSVAKGVAWLKSNQRVSGRWFTQSLNTDRAHYISHAGTAYALMALKACE